MRTRENTRKCTQLRDKQKSMNARIVRSVYGVQTRFNKAVQPQPGYELARCSFKPGIPIPA
jgi:hypothetical protein